jgi:hypothetical protein
MKGISYRPLSDMETNGVYFDKDEMLMVGDESLCQYSGLPSVSSYEEVDEEVVIGHS